MRDARLLVVLAMALGLIVLGGVLVPIVLTTISPSPVRGPELMASAAPEGKIEPLPAPPPEIDKLSAVFRMVAKRVKPAVVAVGVSQTITESGPQSLDDFLHRYFGMGPDEGGGPAPRRQFQRQGLGSGVIVDAGGYILTNNHVVADATDISVHMADGRVFKGKVVGADPPSDIAVIHIDADHLPVAVLGDSSECEVGDLVLAIGSPLGLEQTVTMGIISATGRSGVGITEYENFLQTDAAINPGSSGGPLVNMKGQVIGINSAIASRSGGYMGVGFTVPSSMASEVMKRIREKGSVVRGWIGVGIQPLTPEMAESMKLKSAEGVLISQVFDGGPAAKSGLKVGDVVIEIGGKPVKLPYDLQSAIAWSEPGSKVSLVVMRDGKRETLKIDVERRPDNPSVATGKGGGGADSGAAVEMKDLGIEVSGVTPEATQRYGYKAGQGVLITDVDPAGLGARAGLRPGMLILQAAGQKTASTADLKAALKSADLAKGLPMLVRQADRQMFILIRKR